VEKYGEGIIEELERGRHIPVKLDIPWYEEKIEYYKTKLKDEFGVII